MLWLFALKDLEISDLSVSDDEFHSDDVARSPAKTAAIAARDLGLPVSSITIRQPDNEAKKRSAKGEPVMGSGALLKGRAVEKLAAGLPLFKPESFTECKDEELRNPRRVHLDPFGHVHLCQGLTMGNAFETPLSELVAGYNAKDHPVCGPLLDGGPALLAEEYGLKMESDYASPCHLCYAARRELIDRFPGFLAPRQVYGL